MERVGAAAVVDARRRTTGVEHWAANAEARRCDAQSAAGKWGVQRARAPQQDSRLRVEHVAPAHDEVVAHRQARGATRRDHRHATERVLFGGAVWFAIENR